MQMLEPLIEEPLDYEDERLLANITRASSPDTSGSDSAGGGWRARTGSLSWFWLWLWLWL